MLVGRDVLLQAGEMALRSALDGRGRLLLLTGEAGIGKTTLARALVDRAAHAGAIVRTGACWDSEGLPPFTPWLDALRRPGSDACAAAGEQLGGVGGHEAKDASDALRARGRRFADVVDALRDASAERPQVVVLEDLHWADGESLELLVAVAAHLPAMPVLVIGTVRDDELSSDSALVTVGSNADRVELGGLDDESVAAVLEEVLGRPSTPSERRSVLRQTGGNPLFVTQVARLLAAGSSVLPSGVRDVLARRLARTPTECNRVLGAAAVIGVEFDRPVVEGMLGAPVARELDQAEAARLVTRIEDTPGRWRFVHALVQATRYDLLATDERAGLHREAVRALSDQMHTPASTLAHHAVRGAFDVGDPLPATLLIAAGREALDRMAWPDAVGAFDRALGLAPPDHGGTVLKAEAWLGIGAARLRHGDGDVRAAFDEAASLARVVARPDLVARAALGFSVGLGAFEVRLLDHRQIELLEEAASALAPDHPLLPLVLARLSGALAFVDSSDRRAGLAHRAVDLARASGDAVALGHALAARCDALAGPDHVAERLAASTEVIALAGRAGDLPLELLGRRLRVVALMERCDHVTVTREVAAYERTAATLGDPLYTWYGMLWRATAANADGRTMEAAGLLDEAARVGALGGSTNSALLREVSAAMSAIDRRDGAAADLAMTTMLSLAPDIILAYADILSAFQHAALGDLARAGAALAGVSVAHLDALPRDSEWVCSMVQTAYAAARVGDLALAADLRARLEPVGDCGAVEGIGAYVHGSTHRFLALLAAVAGDREAARAHVDAARAAAFGGGVVLAALTDLDGAWALARSDEPADLARSRALARRAADAFARVGLSAPAAEAEALAEPTSPEGTPTPVAAGALEAGGALTRAGDTWEWSWQGSAVHVRHAKGVADLALLLEHNGKEVHVRELEGVVGSVPAFGSHQAVLDDEAVRQYRQRLVDLEEDLDEADRHGDVGRAARLAAERDSLVDELATAFGVGGRARRVGSDPDERLRKAVSARVKASIDRIEALHPTLGRHLRASVRTGFWCAYEPERPVDWSITRA